MSLRSYRSLLWSVSVLGVLCFIFANSLLPSSASAEESRSFLDLLSEIFPALTHHAVRKLAHLAEYALLGAHFALFPYVWRCRARVALPVMLLFGTLIALLDEGIQHFVPGRGASLTDVLIDSLGYLLALVFVFFVAGIRRGHRNA